MSTIGELGAFLAREVEASGATPPAGMPDLGLPAPGEPKRNGERIAG